MENIHRACRIVLILLGLLGTAALAQEQGAKIDLAGGKLQLKSPKDWVRKQPQSRIIEHEFAVPASAGDANEGRVTIMGAGGPIDANIDRWYSQFSQPDGGSIKERAKVKKFKVAGEDVHLVDLSGTYKDQRGPMAPAVERPKYRMLAAIITAGPLGNYFVKFYGPQQTVTDHEKAFLSMIEGLERK
jgi:hypothetical protein